jgi:hypothetical protein
MKTLMLSMIVALLLLSGCATRQVISELDGATAQRLVTHSIDQLMEKIPAEDFVDCDRKNVYVKPYFINANPAVNYATERFKMELAHSFQCQIVETKEEADYRVSLFFTSLGTEFDIFGLSIPFLVVPGYSSATDINILAVEMFHGISEMYYYVSDAKGQVLVRRDKTKATVRTDKFSLPFISIPYNTLD